MSERITLRHQLNSRPSVKDFQSLRVEMMRQGYYPKLWRMSEEVLKQTNSLYRRPNSKPNSDHAFEFLGCPIEECDLGDVVELVGGLEAME